MEKDDRIASLFKESGIERAPEGFTGGVMDRIRAEPEKRSYQPLIGKPLRIFLILLTAGIVAGSLLSAPSEEQASGAARWLRGLEWQWSFPELNLEFLSNLSIQPWLLSTVVAVFLLILSDAGLKRRKLF